MNEEAPNRSPGRATARRVCGLSWARVGLITAGLLTGCAAPDERAETTGPPLERLKSGNARFAGGQSRHPHADAARRLDTAAHGQHPIAAVVACSDSRVPVELIFDQGIGDVFVIRVAGNVVATDEAGSIEYAVEHLELPLVVIMGHADCGAVKAVVQRIEEHGSIPALAAHIAPAVNEVRRLHPGLDEAALLNAAVEANVFHSIEDLLTHSDMVRERIAAGRLTVIGAAYDLATAKVRWLGPHPRQAELAGKAPG